MAKTQTFASKVEKHASLGNVCPVCEQLYRPVQVVRYENFDGRMRLRKKVVKVCKCNEKEILG